MKIQIAHLYPENLNLYGEKGNIASLVYRLEKRDIEAEVIRYFPDDNIDFKNSDIVFIGGGTDKDRNAVLDFLMKQKENLKAYADDGGVMLACCTGFEIMGKYYEENGKKIPALDILDMYTKSINKRHIGNIVVSTELIDDKIAGFENHGTEVYLGNAIPFGKVISGTGNNLKGDCEGVVYKNTIATYMHGPLLPKNPKLTDYILSKAMERKYGESTLEPLDDRIENAAHDYAVKRFS